MTQEKQTSSVSVTLSLSNTEFLIMADILHQINRTLEERREGILSSHCTFQFDVHYGIYDSFRELTEKIHLIALKKSLTTFEHEEDWQ